MHSDPDFTNDGITPVGEMAIDFNDRTSVHCELVLFKDWEERLSEILEKDSW